MLKLAGSVLLIAAGTLAGYTESHRLAQRVEKLEAFLQFLSAAQTEIRYSAAPVEAILRIHGGSLLFLRECAGQCANGRDFLTAWNGAVAHTAKGEGFFPADRELLLHFGLGFGATDTQGQLSHCSLYTSLFSSSLKSAREERNRKSRLYLMMGVFAGLSASLLLC